MANRREFLSQLQDQLNSWADWVQQLDNQALTSAAKLREDAKAVYEQRAIQVRDLIQQGRGQFERLAEASDDAWEGVSGGAEQAWAALQDAAATLATQATAAANEPTVQPVVGKAEPAKSPRPMTVAKKESAVAKKKPTKAAKPKAKAKAKAKSSAKVKRGGPKRKAATKRKAVAKRKPAAKKKSKVVARKAVRRPARKK